jgi:hypothetical protein
LSNRWLEVIRNEIVFITGRGDLQRDASELGQLIDCLKFQFTGESAVQVRHCLRAWKAMRDVCGMQRG